MVDKVHGKPIDVAKFKSPVLSDIQGHLDKIKSIVTYLADNEESIEQEHCYICNGTQREPVTQIHGFQYVVCSDCGHVYTDKRYTDEAIRRFYETNSYWAEVTYANKETCHYRKENVALPKVEFLEQYLDNKQGKWLDIGSGIGDLVSVVTDRGYEAAGLELSETSVNFCREVFGVELLRQTIDEFMQANSGDMGSFSVVSMIGLLEHVVSPIDVLKQVNQLLKSGGLVMIQVPNAKSMATMVQECYPDNVFRHMSPIEHIMVFTESSLNRALENAGYTPLSYWYHGLDVYELMTNLVMSNERVRDSRLYNLILSSINELQQVIDDAERSDRIICIARKN